MVVVTSKNKVDGLWTISKSTFLSVPCVANPQTLPLLTTNTAHTVGRKCNWGTRKMKHKIDLIVVLKKTIEVEADFECEAVNAIWGKYDDTTNGFDDFDVNRDVTTFAVKVQKDKAYLIVE